MSDTPAPPARAMSDPPAPPAPPARAMSDPPAPPAPPARSQSEPPAPPAPPVPLAPDAPPARSQSEPPAPSARAQRDLPAPPARAKRDPPACAMSDPHGPNYQSARKLKAGQCLLRHEETEATFHLSEALAASLRTMAVYRHEQILASNGQKMHHIKSYLKPIENIIKNKTSVSIKTRLEKSYPNKFLEAGIKKMEMEMKMKGFEPLPKEPFHRRYLRFTDENNVDNFLKILREFPEEWTVIQLTAPYNPNENIKPREEFRAEIDSIYISILRNEYLDATGCEPFTVQLPANVTKEGEKKLFVELYSLLDVNLQTIENAGRTYTQKTIRKYWEKREDTDLRMMSVIDVMDKEWLGGWKCLLTGKLKEKKMRDKVMQLVEGTCNDWGFIRFTTNQKILLANLLANSQHLPSAEIRNTLKIILTRFTNDNETINIIKDPAHKCSSCDNKIQKLNKVSANELCANEVCINKLCIKCLAYMFERTHHFTLVDAIKAFMEAARLVKNDTEWAELKVAKRHPVILIVDEMLDTFPWESLSILTNQPVCRMESLHFLYNLYKLHQHNIVDGCYVMKPDNGRYLINPGNNLERMEKRMSSFMSYWCPEWTGECNKPPEPDKLLQHLKTSDIFLYCGHGDGCQYASGSTDGAGVEMGVRAAALLSGCGSVRLQHIGGRVPPLASHYHYHIAGSPMVMGMLWEVTDLEVDKVVTTMLAQVVPTKAEIPWESVGKAQWSQGILDLNVESKGKVSTEPDLLTAMAKARRSTNFVMISSSVVARGLPIRMETREK